MKIETKFNIGDLVVIDGHQGPVTDISAWVTGEDEPAGIECRIHGPGSNWVHEGLWALENNVERSGK